MIDKNQPAYPVSTDDYRDLSNHPMKGITIRQYYMIHSDCTGFMYYMDKDENGNYIWSGENIIKAKFRYADAMIEFENKEEKEMNERQK